MARWARRHPPLPPWRARQGVCRGWVAFIVASLAAAVAVFVLPVAAVVPMFFEANKMTALRLPSDTEIGELIYLLRASDADKDYPLTFDVSGENSDMISIDSDYEYGYVYLRKYLEPRKNYTFILTVADMRGDITDVIARIITTQGRTQTSDVFIKYSASALVPENAEVGTSITTLIVKKQPRTTLSFQILGPSAGLFRITARINSPDTFKGEILLQGELDYEVNNLHPLTVCAINPYTDATVDTRNIVCVGVSVLVEDQQDMPPIFFWAPPITRITSNHLKGDELVRIMAEDGDRGVARPIRYSILAASTLYANFFAIDPSSGVITLQESVNDVMESMSTLEPILLAVTAVELDVQSAREPEIQYTTTVEIAFVIMDSDMMVPKFVHEQYVGEVRENSPPDTVVSFPNSQFLKPGVRGLIALRIDGDDGIFDVDPNVVRDSSDFIIKVKNMPLLDYETKSKVDFKLIAKQVSGSAQASSVTEVSVNVIDINDNIPEFQKSFYETEILENITAGTSILRIQAIDRDIGDFGAIRYKLDGKLADKLLLDPITGLISCSVNSDDFDREINPELKLMAEACDDNGKGNCAYTRITIRLKDVNDKPPRFLEAIYKGVMSPDQTSLKTPLKVQAVDDDAEEPNNQIVYSIDQGRYSENFRVDRRTGDISVVPGNSPLPKIGALASSSRKERQAFTDEDSVIKFSVSATDQGIPQFSRSVPVQIYTQEYVERFITFIYPKPPIEVRVNEAEIVSTLDTLTGGITEIQDIQDYSIRDNSRSPSYDKSIVTALVRYRYNTVVDVGKLSQQLNSTRRPLTQDPQEPMKIEELQSERNSYLAGVVVLCVIFAIIIIVLLLCCFCAGCPLYRDRKKFKMVGDENAERISYIRVDEQGNYRGGYEEERTWWDYLPNCCTELATNWGIPRPKRNGGRLAWSGDERQRYWQISDRGEGATLEDRALARRGPRDLVLLEDLDEARLAQQGRMVRVDSRLSRHSQDPRRMFVIRDQRGNPRIAESLREGEQYVMESMDETPRNMRMEDPRGMYMDDPQGMRIDDNRQMRMEEQRPMHVEEPRGPPPPAQNINTEENVNYARQGNVEVLRLHASPHGAALRDDGGAGRRVRPLRRAGVESEGILITQEELQRRALMHEDAGGGGISARLVEGQSVGVTPRSEMEVMQDGRAYGPASMRYLPSGSPTQSDVQIQTEEDVGVGRAEHVVPRLRIRTPIEEETNSLLEAEGVRSSRREKRRSMRDSQVSIGEPEVHDDDISRRSLRTNQPANSLYHHTKASILRFETNKAKMDEDMKKESTASRRNSISGTDGRRSSSVDSRSTDGRRSMSQVNLDGRRSNSQLALDGRRSNSQLALDGRRSNSQLAMEGHRGTMSDSRGPSVERHGSLPALETTGLEREAARRSVSRRGSLGALDRQEEHLPAADGKSNHNSEYEEDYEDAKDHRSGRRRRRKESHPRYMEWYGNKGRDGNRDNEHREERRKVVDDGHSVVVTEGRGTGEGSESQVHHSQTEIVHSDSKQQSKITRVDTSTVNLPDDVKAQEGEDELLNIMDGEINLGVSQSSQIFDSDADLEAVAAARSRRKRNHLLEKKSIFTIAYDDSKTEQLRPESAAAEP